MTKRGHKVGCRAAVVKLPFEELDACDAEGEEQEAAQEQDVAERGDGGKDSVHKNRHPWHALERTQRT